MTQEEKKLSLIDFCARLPHGLIVDRLGVPIKVLAINSNNMTLLLDRGEYMPAWCRIDDVKPYLRPMSSMTTDEEYEYHQIRKRNSDKLLALMDCGDHLQQLLFPIIIGTESIDWLTKNMFDYRGLIERGRALIAPKGMYKIEKQQ